MRFVIVLSYRFVIDLKFRTASINLLTLIMASKITADSKIDNHGELLNMFDELKNIQNKIISSIKSCHESIKS